jgi:hypothetical protein
MLFAAFLSVAVGVLVGMLSHNAGIGIGVSSSIVALISLAAMVIAKGQTQ